MKVRINISIGAQLHEKAKKYAESREMDFSELLAVLLRKELENPTSSPVADLPKTAKAPPFLSTGVPQTPEQISASRLNEAPIPPRVAPVSTPAPDPAPKHTKTRAALRAIAKKQQPQQ
jgi:hypothetical protein